MSESPHAPQPPGIQNKLHYRLTSEEWLRISQDLKLAELRVLYYLRTLDPFGDRQLNLKVIHIAQTTGLKKGTVSKVLKVLAEKNYIDLELITIQIRVKKTPVEVSSDAGKFLPGNFHAQPETSQHSKKPESTAGNFQQPKPPSPAASRIPHTLQTDQTSKTLSHLERELIDFVQKRLKNTEGIRDLRAYAIAILEKDREHWQTEFERQQQKADLPPPRPAPVEKVFDEETPAQRLERYRTQWHIPACRPGIRNAIAAHPQWNITLDQLQEPHEHQHHHRNPGRTLSNGSPAS